MENIYIVIDENSNLLDERFQVWNVDHWVNSLFSFYSYDNNNLISVTHQEWGDTNWVNISMFTYDYDDNDNQTLSVEQSWQDSVWMYNSKFIRTYDGNNNLSDMTYQFWNNVWTNSQYFKYTYDEINNLIEEKTNTWNGAGWDNKSMSVFTYNDSLLTYQVDRNWDGADWMDIAKTFNSYDEHKNQIENYYITWEDTVWVNNFKNIYEYGTLTSVNKNPATINSFSLFNNYPNPFNPSTFISWQSPISGIQTLRIYDILGRLVATLVNEYRPAGKYKLEFNPESSFNNLASGVYFYQIRISANGDKRGAERDFVQTKKMIYLK